MGEPARKNWTFLLNDAWTEDNWKCSVEVAVNQVLHELSTLQIASLPSIDYSNIQCWKYAQPHQVVTYPQWNSDVRLALVGEVFQGGRVEGAFLSAVQAYKSIMSIQ